MFYAHSMSHEPEKQDQRYWDEASTPLFPFGHGLAYSRFEYSELSVDRDELTTTDTVTVSVTVRNAGRRDADEVVQVYVHQRHGTASRPVRELKAFRRVHVPAGESTTLAFPLGPDDLRYWNASVRDWVNDVTEFDVWVGGDCTAELATSFRVTAG
jgi:beta-glucosidase